MTRVQSIKIYRSSGDFVISEADSGDTYGEVIPCGNFSLREFSHQ